MENRKLATILRCTGLALFVLGAFVLLPAAAQAQCTPGNHGVSIFKSCTSPKNRCGTDADCSDANLCTGLEQCATEEAPGSNVMSCIITLGNPTSHCDDLTILEASDAVLNATGPGASSTTILITGISTGVVSGTCTAGTDLGGATTCTIAPGGQVTFLANYYTVVPTDPTTLTDQATISVMDTCNLSPTGCSSTPNLAQFTAATTTQSGCSPGTPLVCNDGNACTTDSCVPATGCATTPVVCNDGLFCTDDSCVPATGCATTPHNCSDGLLCTTDTCNETTDGCDVTPVVCASDGLACNGPEACDPTTGGCVSGPAVVCNADGNLCNGPETCVEPAGTCQSGPPLACNDGLFCTDDSCVPATGCTTTAHDCADTDICTDDTCDETADACVHTVDQTNDPTCVPSEEICRTPGFWGTHGGVEKSRSTNITQAVLDSFGGTLFICGATINNTAAGNPNSALEAICVSPKGDSRLQLARQLTAAALNCGITNNTDPAGACTTGGDGAAPCSGVSIEDVFNACNAACPTGTTAVVDGNTISCIGAIDCFNNGGIFDPATGDCASAVESCHDRELVNGCFNFQPSGPAGSPRECNTARKNNIVVVPPLP